MYSWGGDTRDWKDPKGYKWDSARKPYLDKLKSASKAKGPRSYVTRSAPDPSVVDLRGKDIVSNSKNPLVVAVDVTGSMSSWPAEIFDRLPLLYQTLSQYKDDLEISFAAIGDAYCDEYPLQVADFGKGLDLEGKLNALYPEGGGGGQISESYELFAQYMLDHCKTPNATSPFMLIYGDEKFYDEVNKAQVEHYIGDKLQSSPESKDVWEKLMQRFNVFYLQKPYGSGDSHTTKEVKEHWAKILGKQKIIALPSCERAVDIGMGLIAKNWGQFGDFKDNLSARQSESERETVYSSLKLVDKDTSPNSVITKKSKSKKTKPLTASGGA